MKKKNDKRVCVSMTIEQLQYIIRALEEHFRLRMGQSMIDLADDLSFQNVETDENGKIPSAVFDECIFRRNDAQKKLQEFLDIALGRDLKRCRKTEEVQNEIDMWSVFRHWLWEIREPEERGCGVDSYPPFRFGTLPVPEIRWEEKDGQDNR